MPNSICLRFVEVQDAHLCGQNTPNIKPIAGISPYYLLSVFLELKLHGLQFVIAPFPVIQNILLKEKVE